MISRISPGSIRKGECWSTRDRRDFCRDVLCRGILDQGQEYSFVGLIASDYSSQTESQSVDAAEKRREFLLVDVAEKSKLRFGGHDKVYLKERGPILEQKHEEINEMLACQGPIQGSEGPSKKCCGCGEEIGGRAGE